MTTTLRSPIRPAPTGGWPRTAGSPLFRGGRAPGQRSFSALRRSWNDIKTAVLLAGLGGLLVLLGAQFGQVGAVVGLLLGLAAVAGSYCGQVSILEDEADDPMGIGKRTQRLPPSRLRSECDALP